MDGADIIREELRGDYIYLDERSANGTAIFDHVDAFVNLSRDNETVDEVYLFPFSDPDDDASETHRYAICDKVAEGIGNLQALREIAIYYGVDDEEHPLAPDWEILACILRRLRRSIKLCICDDERPLWDPDTLPVFAGAIDGHAMITGFSDGEGFPFDCLNILCSALLTLPALLIPDNSCLVAFSTLLQLSNVHVTYIRKVYMLDLHQGPRIVME
jgi:hypothetical protein